MIPITKRTWITAMLEMALDRYLDNKWNLATLK
jgi:hypothetical protein